MDRSTPEACFAAAQSAMAVGDWDAFFACVAPKSLEQLAAMVLPLASADATGAFAALCREHGVPIDVLDEVRAAGAAVATSAAASTWDPAAPTAEMLDHSLRHRDLVRADAATRLAAARRLPDPAGFVAATERFRRSTGGGGSVSSRLFVDETLTDVVVSGSAATGVRQLGAGAIERVSFVRRRGQWHVAIG